MCENDLRNKQKKWNEGWLLFFVPPDLKCLVYFYSTPLHSNYSWVVLAGKTRDRRIFTFRIKIDNNTVGLSPMTIQLIYKSYVFVQIVLQRGYETSKIVAEAEIKLLHK